MSLDVFRIAVGLGFSKLEKLIRSPDGDRSIKTMVWIAEISPSLNARIAGFFWLLVFVSGSLALYFGPGESPAAYAANIVATLCYAIATVLVYYLLKPVNKPVSFLAAVFSLIGCTSSLFDLARFTGLSNLVFFGLHCLLVSFLILGSTFLPRILGVLMVLAGLGWLTFIWPPFADQLAPYNLIPGMVGEGVLIVWLVAMGVNEQRWIEQASRRLNDDPMSTPRY